MMKQFIVSLLFVVLSISLPSYAGNDDLPEPMSPPCMVNDFSEVFLPVERNMLERRLRAYADSTSTQIYVVTVDTLNGYAISDYAVRLGQKWKIGQKGTNNGILILIKPSSEIERGQIFIATGYGVEPFLNDARVGRIVRNVMIPQLKQGVLSVGK